MAWQKIKLSGYSLHNAHKEGYCPHCGDDALVEYHSLDKDWDSLSQQCYCKRCDETWVEWYKIDFQEKTELDGTRISSFEGE
jgi:transposase-like protein